MQKSKTQELYDLIYSKAQELVGDNNVYQLLPLNADTDYPFVVLNTTNTDTERVTNSKLFQGITVRLDIWGLENQRKELDDIVNSLFNALLPYGLDRNQSSYQILPDTSTDEIFFRAMVKIYVIRD